MGRSRWRRTHAARAIAWLERHGGAALVRVWSVVLGVASRVAGTIEHAAVSAWRAGLVVRLGALAVVAALAWWLALRVPGPTPPWPVVVDETEALARVIRSEVGTSPAEHRVHVAWATRNLAAERGQSIAEMACAPCGEQGAGRPVSSRQAATDGDRALAAAILATSPIADPTGGATHFINPALQDELAASGRVPGYRGNPYDVVRRRWTRSYGWAPYYRLGPSLELWGPARR